MWRMCHYLSNVRSRLFRGALVVIASAMSTVLPGSQTLSNEIVWEPLGLSGGGGMFSPAISPLNADLMMINCDMSGAYISQDGGHHCAATRAAGRPSTRGIRALFSRPRAANCASAVMEARTSRPSATWRHRCWARSPSTPPIRTRCLSARKTASALCRSTRERLGPHAPARAGSCWDVTLTRPAPERRSSRRPTRGSGGPMTKGAVGRIARRDCPGRNSKDLPADHMPATA
jgi:hypothetical protein